MNTEVLILNIPYSTSVPKSAYTYSFFGACSSKTVVDNYKMGERDAHAANFKDKEEEERSGKFENRMISFLVP